MPTVKDVRDRAEEALHQGKVVLESVQRTAQAKLSDAVGAVSSAAERGATQDVRVGGRTVSVDSFVADFEAMLKRYSEAASQRSDALFSEIKQDDRFAKLVDRAESVLRELRAEQRLSQLVERAEVAYDALSEMMQDRLVAPAKDLLGKSSAKPTATSSAEPTRKASSAKASPVKKTAPATAATAKSAAPAKKAAPAKAASTKAAAPAKKSPPKP